MEQDILFSDDVIEQYLEEYIDSDASTFQNQTKENKKLVLRIVLTKNYISKYFDKITNTTKKERRQDLLDYETAKRALEEEVEYKHRDQINQFARIIEELINDMIDDQAYFDRFGTVEKNAERRANTLRSNNLYAQLLDKETLINYLVLEKKMTNRLEYALQASKTEHVITLMKDLCVNLTEYYTKSFDMPIVDEKPKFIYLSEVEIVNRIMESTSTAEIKELLKSLQYVVAVNNNVRPANFEYSPLLEKHHALGLYENPRQTISIDYEGVVKVSNKDYKEALINVVLHETAHRIQHEKRIRKLDTQGKTIIFEELQSSYLDMCGLFGYLRAKNCSEMEKEARDLSIIKMLRYAHDDNCRFKSNMKHFAYNYAISRNNMSDINILTLLSRDCIPDSMKDMFDSVKNVVINSAFQANSVSRRKEKFNEFVSRTYGELAQDYENMSLSKENDTHSM